MDRERRKLEAEAAKRADEKLASDAGLLPHIFGGVAGRVAAESFKSPFDLLKVRLQYDTTLKSLSVPVALVRVLREEGLNAWRGLPPRLIWSAPLAGATFTYYQVLKKETGGNSDSTSGFSLKTVLGGPMVLALSVGLRTPFDIVEQQLQLNAAAAAQASASTSGTTAAAPPGGAAPPQPLSPTPRAIANRIHTTWRAEGAKGVWRGYPAAFGGIATYVAGYFVVYEGARRVIEENELFDGHPTATHLVAGGLGGGATAVLSTPFDTIKVRMQTKIYATADNPFPSFMHVLRSTLRDAGWSGVWRGAAHRALSNAPSGAIMFAVYETGWRWVSRKILKSERE